jgi:hypothetical protein
VNEAAVQYSGGQSWQNTNQAESGSRGSSLCPKTNALDPHIFREEAWHGTNASDAHSKRTPRLRECAAERALARADNADVLEDIFN